MMEVRLERLCNLASELSTLHESRRSTFARCSQASSTVDDIIAKMEFLKEVVLQEEDVLNRAASRRMSALRKRSIFTKKSSNASSSGTVITHATINGDAQFDVKQAASRLYDVENYSKCVRLIEKVPPAETDRDLLLLCHGSYKHMLSDAANTREASKLCEWWRAFVEKLESEKACQHFRLEILECLAECLWETSRLPLPLDSSTARERIMDDLMITKIELYQRTRIDYRPFHVRYLRRMEHICFILADYFSVAEEDERLPDFVHMGISIVTEALAESRDDEKKYRQETGGQRTDPNLLECCKLLEDMSALLVHIENVELSRDRYSESTRTSGLGTPLHSPDGMREEIELEEGRLESFCKSAQILTTVEVHTSKGCQEVNNNNDFTSLKNVDDLEDDESFVLHL